MKEQRKIPIEVQDANEKRWKEIREPELLSMLRKVDERVWRVITENKLKPLTGELSSAFLHGKVGAGKSVNAAWRMLEWSRLKHRQSKVQTKALFVNTGEFLQELRNSYDVDSSSELQIIEKYKTVDMLIFDDFGAHRSTDWVYQILYLIINWRYSHFKPTIYTSNNSLQELTTMFNDERIISRIEHDCGKNIFEFKQKSKRKQL